MMAINSFREVKDLLIRMQVSVREHLKSDLNAKTKFPGDGQVSQQGHINKMTIWKKKLN